MVVQGVLAIALGLVSWYVGYWLLTSLSRSPFVLFYGLCFVSLVMAGVLTSVLGLADPMYLVICAGPLAMTVVVTVPRVRARGRERR